MKFELLREMDSFSARETEGRFIFPNNSYYSQPDLEQLQRKWIDGWKNDSLLRNQYIGVGFFSIYARK